MTHAALLPASAASAALQGPIGPCDVQRMEFSTAYQGEWTIHNCYTTTKRVVISYTTYAGTIIVTTDTGCISLASGATKTGQSATNAGSRYC